MPKKDEKGNIKLKGKLKFALYISTFFLMIIDKPLKVNAETSGFFDYKYEINHKELEASDIIKLINKSDNLTCEQKDVIINGPMFKRALPYIKKYQNEEILKKRLTNICIKDYNDAAEIMPKSFLDKTTGFYLSWYPNNIYLSDNDNNVLTHEFIHMFQSDSQYKYILESLCELYNNEFYTNYTKSYRNGIKRLKVLMEIIGSQPVEEYMYSSNSVNLDLKMLRYIDENDLDKLKRLFKENPETYLDAHKEIDQILSKMYYNKYHEDISSNVIITNIYNSSYYDRKYFNITTDYVISLMKNGLYNNEEIKNNDIENVKTLLYYR